jgi:hypothetical protein
MLCITLYLPPSPPEALHEAAFARAARQAAEHAHLEECQAMLARTSPLSSLTVPLPASLVCALLFCIMNSSINLRVWFFCDFFFLIFLFIL